MNILSRLQNQAGFTLIQAVFVVVVMSLLGVAMMRLIGVQTTTSSMALQGARGYQAARSGLEWGAAQASAGASCNSGGPMGIEGFNVTVSCSSQPFIEGTVGPYDVYRINALAEYGTDHRSPDYISRRLEMKVGFLP
jgi:Tfp pilus assembly protein PilV